MTRQMRIAHLQVAARPVMRIARPLPAALQPIYLKKEILVAAASH